VAARFLAHAFTVYRVGGRVGLEPGEFRARLILYEDRVHGGAFADRRFGGDVIALLKAQNARA
jgi:hypothetical protein